MTPHRRWILAAVLAALVVAVTFGVLAMLPQRPGVSRANFEKIQDGMSKAEVSAILEGDTEVDLNYNLATHSCAPRPTKLYAWVAVDGAFIAVEFAPTGVVDKRFDESYETIIMKVHRWLGLPLNAS